MHRQTAKAPNVTPGHTASLCVCVSSNENPPRYTRTSFEYRSSKGGGVSNTLPQCNLQKRRPNDDTKASATFFANHKRQPFLWRDQETSTELKIVKPIIPIHLTTTRSLFITPPLHTFVHLSLPELLPLCLSLIGLCDSVAHGHTLYPFNT